MWWLVAAQLFTSYLDGQNSQAQADYNSVVARENAELSRAQGRRVIERGEREVKDVRNKATQVLGSQRAGMAANGIDISSGSALDVQSETLEFSLEDAETIRNNAFLESLGYEQQAKNYISKADQDQSAVENKRNSSLISAGFTVAGRAYGSADNYAANRNTGMSYKSGGG